MLVIFFVNVKGGVGKIIVVFLLVIEVVVWGKRVIIFDVDLQKWILKWLELLCKCFGIFVVSEILLVLIIEQIILVLEVFDYVIVDLEGMENLIVVNVLFVLDLVVVLIQGLLMDVCGGVKILMLIKKLEKIVWYDIKYCVVFICINVVVMICVMKVVQDFLCIQNIDVFMMVIVECVVFCDLFEFGGGLEGLDFKQIFGVIKVWENVFLYVVEVLEWVIYVFQKCWYNMFKCVS